MNRIEWTLAVALAASVARAQTRKLTPNLADEQRAELSIKKGLDFAAGVTAAWSRRHSCVTCHTNGLFLLTGATLAPRSAAHRENLQFARDYLQRFVIDGEKQRGRKGSIEGVVATAALLAIAERKTDGVLGATTRKALDYVFEKQSPAGHWGDWLKCNWPPFEVDDFFGVTLVALAVGSVPTDYRRTKKVQTGVRRLRAWLRENPPRTPHQKALILWAATGLPSLAKAAMRSKWRTELLDLQKPDGGWVLAELGGASWTRQDGSPQDTESDAYATAFTLFVLQRSGTPATHEGLRRGIAWLSKQQRASGRWFVRSPRRDTRHYITHAATNFALMVLAKTASGGTQR